MLKRYFLSIVKQTLLRPSYYIALIFSTALSAFYFHFSLLNPSYNLESFPLALLLLLSFFSPLFIAFLIKNKAHSLISLPFSYEKALIINYFAVSTLLFLMLLFPSILYTLYTKKALPPPLLLSLLVIVAIPYFFNTLFSNLILYYLTSYLTLFLINAEPLTHSLSLPFHLRRSFLSLASTSDIVFHLFIIFFLLTTSTFISKYKRGYKVTKKDKHRLPCLFLLALFILFIGSKFNLTADFSKNKLYTPSSYTRSLMKAATFPLYATYYRSNEAKKFLPSTTLAVEFIKKSLPRNAIFTIKSTDSSALLLEELNIKPKTLPISTPTGLQYKALYSTLLLEYNGKTTLIDFILDIKGLEVKLDIALERLLYGKVYNLYLYPPSNSAKVNPSFFSDYGINILSLPSLSSLPIDKDGILLVIGSALSATETDKIDDFLLQEGRAIFLSSSYDVDIDKDWSVTPSNMQNFNSYLSKYGIEINNTITADSSCFPLSLTQKTSLSSLNTLYPLWVKARAEDKTLAFFWSSSIKVNNNSKDALITPLAFSSNNAYNISVNSTNDINPFNYSSDDYNRYSKKEGQNLLALHYKSANKTRPAEFDLLASTLFLSPTALNYLATSFNFPDNYLYILKRLLLLLKSKIVVKD